MKNREFSDVLTKRMIYKNPMFADEIISPRTGRTLVGANGAMPLSFGDSWFVSPDGNDGYSGKSPSTPFRTVQKAVDSAQADDTLYLAPGEYDENVTVTKRLNIFGVGPWLSVRITALTNGTALTLSGVNEVSVYNVNLEGRGTGGAVALEGQIRRVSFFRSKFHGGATGFLVNPGSGGQIVDCLIDDCDIASVTTGISNSVGGGDPTHRLIVQNSRFYAITTDCIKSAGSAINTLVKDNHFANDSDTEPTRFIKLDGSGDSGLVAGNQFATATNANTKFVLDADVMWGANATEAGWSSARPA